MTDFENSGSMILIRGLIRSHPGLVQMIFEIDMRSVYQFHEAHKTDGIIDMTKERP
jgi:hypothetical protein